MKAVCKYLLILIVFVSGNLYAQKPEKSPRELGFQIQRFSDIGFIYKGGARLDKNRHFRVSVNDMFFYWYPDSRNYQFAGLNLRIGTEKRKQILEKIQFIRGLQFNIPFLYKKVKNEINYNPWQTIKNVETEYDLGLGLNYLLGFRYALNSKLAITIEGLPGIIFYPRADLNTSNDESVQIDAGSVFCSVTCLLNRKIKKIKE